MKVTYRKWDAEDATGRKRTFAGKMVLRPETPEEQAELDDFRAHIGSPQRGRTFEVIYRRRGTPQEPTLPQPVAASPVLSGHGAPE